MPASFEVARSKCVCYLKKLAKKVKSFVRKRRRKKEKKEKKMLKWRRRQEKIMLSCDCIKRDDFLRSSQFKCCCCCCFKSPAEHHPLACFVVVFLSLAYKILSLFLFLLSLLSRINHQSAFFLSLHFLLHRSLSISRQAKFQCCCCCRLDHNTRLEFHSNSNVASSFSLAAAAA